MKTCRYCEDTYPTGDPWCSYECYDLWVRALPASRYPSVSHADNSDDRPHLKNALRAKMYKDSH